MTRIIAISAAPLLCFFFLSLLSFQTRSQPNDLGPLCNGENFTRTSMYGSNRDIVLSSLRNRSSLESYSNATAGLGPDRVYGMSLCRLDINTTSCSECVQTATQRIPASCLNQKEGFIVFDECTVRYSNFSFFTLLEESPGFAISSPIRFPESFKQLLPKKIDELILRATSSVVITYFAQDYERVTQLEGLYDLEAMVQCSPDLGPQNCSVCLRDAFHDFLGCCTLKQPSSAHVFYPKCRVKYNISSVQPTVSNLGVTKGDSHRNGIVGRTFVAVMTASVFALMGS